MPHDNSRAVCYTTAAKVLAPSAKLVLLLENLREQQELVYRSLGPWPDLSPGLYRYMLFAGGTPLAVFGTPAGNPEPPEP